MADRITNYNGNPIKLIDNGDGTFSISSSLVGSLPNVAKTNGSSIATASALVAGKSAAGKQVPISVDADGKLQVGSVLMDGKTIIAAGKKTDADASDRSITTTGFNHISIINDGPAELILAVDDSALTSTKKIYVSDSEGFEGDISGTVLHYTIANDSCIFRYILM